VTSKSVMMTMVACSSPPSRCSVTIIGTPRGVAPRKYKGPSPSRTLVTCSFKRKEEANAQTARRCSWTSGIAALGFAHPGQGRDQATFESPSIFASSSPTLRRKRVGERPVVSRRGVFHNPQTEQGGVSLNSFHPCKIYPATP